MIIHLQNCISNVLKNVVHLYLMQNDEIQKQFQFIKDNTLACFVYDIPCELSFEEVKELGRRELIQWALYDACLKVNDELADI